MLLRLAQLIVAFACGSAMIFIGMENGYVIGAAALGGSIAFTKILEHYGLLPDDA